MPGEYGAAVKVHGLSHSSDRAGSGAMRQARKESFKWQRKQARRAKGRHW
jgi:hypothetical protein